MRLIAIGDLHAYKTKFETLLSKLEYQYDFNESQLVFLGDYVDGGWQAAELVSLLRSLQEQYPHWVFLKGNHEQMMFDATLAPEHSTIFQMWYRQGGANTAFSYRQAPKDQLQSDLLWLVTLPTVYETEKYIFVHAGLLPNTKSVDETDDFTRMWIRNQFYESNWKWPKFVVAGHTYHKKPLIKNNLAVIDTMLHDRGVPTALVLEEDGRRITVQ